MAQVFEVLSPGLLTTVQDRGRHGYQAFGMPVAGAVDEYAFRAANIILGNDENAAALELTLLGPKLKVLADTVIALTGADLGARLNGHELPCWQVVAVKAGDEISFAGVKSGCRAYLAVAGGIDVPVIMGSRSTYLRGKIGGLEGRALKAGDRLSAAEPPPGVWARVGRRVPPQLIPTYDSPITLRVVMGPQDDHFTAAGCETFLNSEYTVTNEADRMGYRLEGPKIEHAAGADIISDGIPLGAIQVPGHGMPIVMLSDRQTTGGYPKIATVASADLYRIGQARPGDKVRFLAIKREQALQLLKRQEAGLRHLAGALREPIGPVRHFRFRMRGKTYDISVEEIR